jgi:arsenate reductase
MAEGLVNAFYGDRFQAWSAGTEPSGVNPYAVKVMAELGIDISTHRSKGVEGFLEREIDMVITVCDQAKETCPYFAGGQERVHRSFKDPAAVEGADGEKLAAFRQVRDEIRAWLEGAFGG